MKNSGTTRSSTSGNSRGLSINGNYLEMASNYEKLPDQEKNKSISRFRDAISQINSPSEEFLRLLPSGNSFVFLSKDPDDGAVVVSREGNHYTIRTDAGIDEAFGSRYEPLSGYEKVTVGKAADYLTNKAGIESPLFSQRRRLGFQKGIIRRTADIASSSRYIKL